MVDRVFAEDLQPRSELVVPEHHIPRAKFPCIDAHNHLPVDDPRMANVDLDAMVRMLDYANIKAVVNLSGGSGDVLQRNLDGLDRAYPGRFHTFCNVHWGGVGESEWLSRTTAQLAAGANAGAKGLKVFKQLGLSWRDSDGELIMPDDPRISDVWEQVGELGLPVLIHTADPRAFFRPLDRFNERWDELHAHPAWMFYGPEFPPFEALIDSLYATMEAHPGTTFITAHVGCYPENLGFVSDMMDRYPNFYTDISARIAELGRAPYSARRWFCKYADRILFGTDHTPELIDYQTHFRFLETDDEYIEYRPGAAIQPQGRWRIYGVYLPDEVLAKVYYDNAARLLGLDAD